MTTFNTDTSSYNTNLESDIHFTDAIESDETENTLTGQFSRRNDADADDPIELVENDVSLLDELELATTIVEPEEIEGPASISLYYPEDDQFPVLRLTNANTKKFDKFEFEVTFNGARKTLRMERDEVGTFYSSWRFLIWDEALLNKVIAHAQHVATVLKLTLEADIPALLSRLESIRGPRFEVVTTPKKKTVKVSPTQVKAQPPAKPQTQVTSKPDAKPNAKRPANSAPTRQAQPVTLANSAYVVGQEVVGRVTERRFHGVMIEIGKDRGFLKFEEKNAHDKGGVDHGSLLVDVGDEVTARVAEILPTGFMKLTFLKLGDAELDFLSRLIPGQKFTGKFRRGGKCGYHVDIGLIPAFLTNEQIPEAALKGLSTEKEVTVWYTHTNLRKRLPHVTMVDPATVRNNNKGRKQTRTGEPAQANAA